MRALAALLPVTCLALVAGCFSPSYQNGGLACSAGGQCPEGYHCAVDNSCWQNGSDPDAAGVLFDLSGTVSDQTGGADQTGIAVDMTMSGDLKPGPGCGDNIKNGMETDVDCGGGTCPGCAIGKKCLVGSDCQSNFCNVTTKLCVMSQCLDGLANGMETDVDCGGPSCAPCAVGKKCVVDGDCASGLCANDKTCAVHQTLKFAAAVGYTTSAGSYGVAIGSFQTPSKGAVDVAATSSDGTLTIFFGDGAGGLLNKFVKGVGISAKGVVIGNFHTGGANLQDIAVADGRMSVNVFGNMGSNTFNNGITYAAQQMNPTGIALGDLNGDTHPDIVLADLGGTPTVGVLLGNNLGTFAAVTNFTPVGSSPVAVAVGDFDKDAKLDVVVAASGDNQINFFRGNGAGGLAPRVNFNSGASPVAIAVADLNGDGNLDVVTANNGGNASVLLGNGNGTFGVAKGWAAGSQPSGVAIADFDSDGRLDLAVSNLGGGVSILLGDGKGNFAAPKNFTAGTNPWWVVAGDLNGDGKPDLVVANNGGGDISVLLNTSN